MLATSPPPIEGADRPARRDRVSFRRLLWVGPLTVAAALALNLLIKTVVVALDPSLSRMGQLGTPLVSLTLQGAVAAVAVFALMAALVPRPIFWYRVVAVVALLVSLVPDVALGTGGAAARWGMRLMGPFLSLGRPSGPPPGAGGPPPGGGMPALPLEQVGLLVLLHLATFAVCVLLLTTRSVDRPEGSRAWPLKG